MILSLVNNLNAYGGKDQYVRWAAEESGINVTSSDSFFSDPVIKGFYKAYVKVQIPCSQATPAANAIRTVFVDKSFRTFILFGA